MPSAEEAFRRLSIGDVSVIAWATAGGGVDGSAAPAGRLDPRTEALLRVGALVAIDAPATAYLSAVESAQLAGARLEDLFAVLRAVAASVGSARVIAAAPKIALAAGYDVEAALE